MKVFRKIVLVLLLVLPAAIVYHENVSVGRAMVDDHWPQKLTLGDQNGIYVTFKEAIGIGTVPQGIKNGWLGVGYISLMGFYHKLSALWMTPNLDESFVFNGIFYIVLAVQILSLMMFRIARHQSPATDPIVIAISSAILIFSFFKLSTLLRFAWIPWSHYASACMGILCIWSFYEILQSQKTKWFFILGFFGFLFITTRRHEASAVLVAMLLTASFLVGHSFLRKKIKWDPRWVFKIGVLLVALLPAYGFVKYFSNNMPMNSHYAQLRAENSYIDQYMRVYPHMIPLRIVQTFVDPNFYSLNNKYEITTVMDHSFSFESFKMPMIYQIPILLYLLPAVLFALISLFFRKKTWSDPLSPALLALVLGFSTYSVITCGYLATAVWGGTHLQNGSVREFLFASLALLVAAGPGLALVVFKEDSGWKKWAYPLAGILLLPVLLGQVVFTNMWKLNMPSYTLESVQAEHQCSQGRCHVNFKFFLPGHREFQPPFQETIVNFNCPFGIDGKPLALGQAGITKLGPSFDFEVLNCPNPVDIEVYPLFLGYCGSGNPSLKISACSAGAQDPACKKL